MSRARIYVYRIQEQVRLHRMGEPKGEVARLMGVSPTTERTYREVLREAGLLDGDPRELPSEADLRALIAAKLTRSAPQQRSSISSWEDRILDLVKKDNTARAIHALLESEAKQQGQSFGSYDAVKRMVRRLRKALDAKPGDVSIPVHTDPGEVAQVDFGYVGKVLDPKTGKVRKAWVFLMVLGFSRHMFARVVFDQKAETWLRLHVQAFEALGGVVAVVVPDNLKSAVIRAAFGKTEKPELNRSYCELARHYDFKIDPTPPRDPQKKGKVESGVKYLRSSFIKPRADELATTSVDRLNEDLEVWVRDTAGLRIHGTTRQQPLVAFEQEEKSELRSLPPQRYELAVWSQLKVYKDSHVRVHEACYSVPYVHLGNLVSVRTTRRSVEIYVEAKRVATHARVLAGKWSTEEAHLPAERAPYRHRNESYWRERAAKIGEQVGQWVAELFDGDPVLSRVNTAQRAVLFLETVTSARAEAACRRARHFESYSVKALRGILKRGLEGEPLDEAESVLPPEKPETTPPRFARTPAEVAAWARSPRPASAALSTGGAL